MPGRSRASGRSAIAIEKRQDALDLGDHIGAHRTPIAT